MVSRAGPRTAREGFDVSGEDPHGHFTTASPGISRGGQVTTMVQVGQ